jgi:dihydrofolate reductase (trimethoprim resistance protein)
MTETPTDKKLSERFAEARDAKVFSGVLLDEVQAALRVAEFHPSAGAFKLHDPVQKKSGASWRGKVVGFYATGLTPRGYCVESANEPGSVQIYPEAALVEWKPELSHPSAIREAVEGDRERCSICDEIVEIDDERIRQEERGFVDSPGGFEHMGDVWNQISKWAAAIRARGEEKGNG